MLRGNGGNYTMMSNPPSSSSQQQQRIKHNNPSHSHHSSNHFNSINVNEYNRNINNFIIIGGKSSDDAETRQRALSSVEELTSPTSLMLNSQNTNLRDIEGDDDNENVVLAFSSGNN